MNDKDWKQLTDKHLQEDKERIDKLESIHDPNVSGHSHQPMLINYPKEFIYKAEERILVLEHFRSCVLKTQIFANKLKEDKPTNEEEWDNIVDMVNALWSHRTFKECKEKPKDCLEGGDHVWKETHLYCIICDQTKPKKQMEKGGINAYKPKDSKAYEAFKDECEGCKEIERLKNKNNDVLKECGELKNKNFRLKSLPCMECKDGCHLKECPEEIERLKSDIKDMKEYEDIENKELKGIIERALEHTKEVDLIVGKIENVETELLARDIIDFLTKHVKILGGKSK